MLQFVKIPFATCLKDIIFLCMRTFITARSLIIVKHTATFLLELQSTWVPNLTGKRIRSVKQSAICDHVLFVI